jgi:transcriptional regulator with XRE-family HTH domain
VDPRTREVIAYIGANVRRLRLKSGLTQEQLAETTGLELRSLQRVESGRTKIGIDTLVLLADTLGVKPGALLRETTVPEVKRGRPKKGER